MAKSKLGFPPPQISRSCNDHSDGCLKEIYLINTANVILDNVCSLNATEQISVKVLINVAECSIWLQFIAGLISSQLCGKMAR